MTAPRFLNPDDERIFTKRFYQSIITVNQRDHARLPFVVYEHTREGGQQQVYACGTLVKAMDYVYGWCTQRGDVSVDLPEK